MSDPKQEKESGPSTHLDPGNEEGGAGERQEGTPSDAGAAGSPRPERGTPSQAEGERTKK